MVDLFHILFPTYLSVCLVIYFMSSTICEIFTLAKSFLFNYTWMKETLKCTTEISFVFNKIWTSHFKTTLHSNLFNVFKFQDYSFLKIHFPVSTPSQTSFPCKLISTSLMRHSISAIESLNEFLIVSSK